MIGRVATDMTLAAVFAWGVAVGYVVAKILVMIDEIRAARREAQRRIAEARARMRDQP